MSSLIGTTWRRKRDDALIRIDGDSSASDGRSNRNLLAVNTSTGRHFWVTPEGLSRRYVKFEEMR